MTTAVLHAPRSSTSSGQLLRFGLVGAANTVLFLGLYLVLRLLFAATAANVLATLVTTVTGTGANGRMTFGAATVGLRHQAKGLAVTVVGLVITTAAVSGYTDAGPLTEAVVLAAAGAVAGAVRFALFRCWVFSPASRAA